MKKKIAFKNVPIGGHFRREKWSMEYIKTKRQQASFNDYMSNANSVKGLFQIWFEAYEKVFYYSDD